MALMMTIIVWAAISLLLLMHRQVENELAFMFIHAGGMFLLFWIIVNGLKLLV